MDLNINWVAVVVAIVIGMAIAWVWYSDWGLFGSTWRALTGVTKEDSAAGGKTPFITLVVSIAVTAVALAVACAIVFEATERSSAWLALTVGFASWIGFSLSTLLQHNGFELKPPRLTIINSAYQLILFLGMSIPIGLLQ